jgi:zinc protease
MWRPPPRARPRRALVFWSAAVLSSQSSLSPSSAADAREQHPLSETAASVSTETRPPPPRLTLRRTRLDNGLRIVLQRDTSLPTVAIAVAYAVGTRNELADEQGFAFWLEHAMFQGSRNVAAGEHARQIEEQGGSHAAWTSSDRTLFVDVLPAHALALGLWLEADRMKSLELSGAELGWQARLLELEVERRDRDSATRGARELQALVFGEAGLARPSGNANGSASAAQLLPGLRAFQQRYYAPNNAVLTLAGNFEVLEALNLIHIYFADARSASLPPAPAGAAPEQSEPRSSTLQGPRALWEGWAIPAKRTPDHYALELAAVTLGTGVTSRLYQALVAEKPLAQAVTVWTDDHRGPDLFGVEATLFESTDPELVSRSIQNQIASLARFGPTSLELVRAQNLLRSRLLLSLDGNRARAIALADAELFSHDARLLETDFERYRQVSREDVQRAVARYLRSAVRNSVLMQPGSP